MAELKTKSPGAAYLTKDNIAIPPESVYPQLAHQQAAEVVEDDELLAEDWPQPRIAPFVDTTPAGPVPRVDPIEPPQED